MVFIVSSEYCHCLLVSAPQYIITFSTQQFCIITHRSVYPWYPSMEKVQTPADPTPAATSNSISSIFFFSIQNANCSNGRWTRYNCKRLAYQQIFLASHHMALTCQVREVSTGKRNQVRHVWADHDVKKNTPYHHRYSTTRLEQNQEEPAAMANAWDMVLPTKNCNRC